MNIHIEVLFTSIAFTFRKRSHCPLTYFLNYHLKRNTIHVQLIDVVLITKYVYFMLINDCIDDYVQNVAFTFRELGHCLMISHYYTLKTQKLPLIDIVQSS